jgi:hypothetical protein
MARALAADSDEPADEEGRDEARIPEIMAKHASVMACRLECTAARERHTIDVIGQARAFHAHFVGRL